MEKYIYNDEKAYRKAMYHASLQNLAISLTNFHMLCRIISTIEADAEYQEILEVANKQWGNTVAKLAEIFDKQAQEDLDLSGISIDELKDLI